MTSFWPSAPSTWPGPKRATKSILPGRLARQMNLILSAWQNFRIKILFNSTVGIGKELDPATPFQLAYIFFSIALEYM